MTSIMPKPFLKSAMEELKVELRSKATSELADLFAKTLASPRSRPTSPWPFGTVVRNPTGRKAMVIVSDPKFANRFYGIYVTGPDEGEMFSLHIDNYEPVLEPDD